MQREISNAVKQLHTNKLCGERKRTAVCVFFLFVLCGAGNWCAIIVKYIAALAEQSCA